VPYNNFHINIVNYYMWPSGWHACIACLCSDHTYPEPEKKIHNRQISETPSSGLQANE